GLEFKMPSRGIDGKPGWRWLEMQHRAARHTIESLVLQDHVGWARHPGRANAATRTLFAAHLEQVREVVVEQECQVEAFASFTVVAKANPLVRSPAPKKNCAHDMKHVLCQRQPAVTIDVGVGEIDRQRRIVVAQVGAKKQWLEVVEQEFEPCKVPSIDI